MFGKIMLNGCDTEREWVEIIQGGTRTHKETMKVGYLKRDQLAFVYRLVNAMRRFPPSEQHKGLTPAAIEALRICDSAFAQFYDEQFHDTASNQSVFQDFQNRIVAIQHSLAELNKSAIYVRASFCETSEDFFKSGHRRLEALDQTAAGFSAGDDGPSTLRFLRGIQGKSRLDRLSSDLNAVQNELGSLLNTAKRIGFILSRNNDQFPPPSPEKFRIIACPKDGTKLRLPEGSGHLVVRCPACKNKIVYDRSALTFAEPRAARIPTWKDRLSSWIRGRKAG